MQSNCSACAFVLDGADNFCRRCGVSSAASANLPATRTNTSITLWRPHASPVVKGAAVMAAGTIGQFVVRRAISGLVGVGSTGQGRKRRSIFARKNTDGLQDEAQIITETMMVRRVRIRRPS